MILKRRGEFDAAREAAQRAATRGYDLGPADTARSGGILPVVAPAARERQLASPHREIATWRERRIRVIQRCCSSRIAALVLRQTAPFIRHTGNVSSDIEVRAQPTIVPRLLADSRWQATQRLARRARHDTALGRPVTESGLAHM